MTRLAPHRSTLLAGVTALVALDLLTIALAGGARAAYPVTGAGTCSSVYLADAPVRYAADLHSERSAVADRRLASAPRRAEASARGAAQRVRVFVHILRTAHGGGVGDTRLHRQMRILNRAYAGKQSAAAAVSPFLFRIAGIDRTTNSRWYRMDEGTVTEQRAKRALHRGNAADLNLYIGMNRSDSLGWGTQPGTYDQAPLLDGVVIRRTTMAGGKGGHYSWGDAAVHETGHWLGLLHTFNGRCGTRGDLVTDTPREARPSYTCPIHRNTCTAPRRDPVHNFMDYSYDRCMNQFTPGQVSRMRSQWWSYRAGGG